MRINFIYLMLLFSISAFGQGTGEVIITEYHNRPLKPTDEQLAAALPNNPAGADTSPNEGHTEWFEVYNTTDQPVVMDGWTLTDASSSSNVTTIGSFTLAPHSYAVFSGFNIPEAQGGVEFDYFYDYKKPSFNNESSYADDGDTSCPDGVIIAKADGSLVDEVRYDYGYGEYIGNMDSGSCMDNTEAIGIPAAGGSSKVSFMLNVDPAVMNSTANDLASNWSFSTYTYDVAGDQVGTPGLQNDFVSSTDNLLQASAVSIYPNPANTVINVVSEIEGTFTTELYDLVGKRINSLQMTNNSMDVSQLPTGMYLLKLNFEEGSVTKRIAIQR
ncbi:MAG: T9SS type A sorting domain-containing protein [Lewinella sp.]|uniref:T9SS type A sorting domain-containing protein n=1 Tax=Lewinella sp. TaxID=2004506 RepID=UPI003D6A05E8